MMNFIIDKCLTKRDQVVVKKHGHESKQSPNLPILRIIHELKGIMVNKD